MNAPLAILGIPSVKEVVEKIVNVFWGALADALTPDWLKDASGKFFSWMVAIPNPAAGQAKNILVLESYTMALAWGIFGVVALATAVRYYAAGAAGDVNPAEGLGRILAAAGVLGTYNWIFLNATALVNQITHQIFSWPVVAGGLNSLAKSIFVSEVAHPTPLNGIINTIALILIIALFAVKIAMMIVLVMIYVGGPLAIAVWALPELQGITAGWRDALGSVLMVPIVWTLLFATAAVFVKDIPTLLGLGNSGLAKAGATLIFTPLFGLIVLIVGYKSATGAFASLKASGHRLVAGASPMGGNRSRAAGFAAGMAGSEARGRIRGSLKSEGSGTSQLRQMALASAGAATGGAATAASAGAAAASGGAAGAQAVPAASPAAATRAIGTGSPAAGSGSSSSTDHGASVPPARPSVQPGAPAASKNGSSKNGGSPAAVIPASPMPATKPSGATKPASTPPAILLPAAPASTPRAPGTNGSAPKSPTAPQAPATPPVRAVVERANNQAPHKRPSTPPPAAAPTPATPPQRSSLANRPSPPSRPQER